MHRNLLVMASILSLLLPLGALAQLSGPLSGILGPGTYTVVGDIQVNESDALTIMAGTTLLFDGDYEFTIDGYISAAGTEEDSIIFEPSSAGQSWSGIEIHATSSNECCFEYCSVSGVIGTGYPDNYGGAFYISGASPQIKHCLIAGNRANWTGSHGGGGIYCENGCPVIVASTISNNISEYRGGGVYFQNSSPSIEGCTISQNTSAADGGGMYFQQGAGVLDKCIIFANTAEGNGGGLFCSGTPAPTITNCTIHGNLSAIQGGGIYCESACPTIKNGIISSNDGGGGIYFADAQETSVMYCDFHDNTGGNFSGEIPFLHLGRIAFVNDNGHFCDIYMNIFEDPMYADAHTGDFHLTESSACIDAGDPTFPLDPDNTTVDMGAYYFFQNLLPEPYNLEADLNTLMGQVTLTWEFDGSGTPGIGDTLIYDQGLTSNGYYYEGYTMSTHMSPAEPCQVLQLLYAAFVEGGTDDEFNAEVYPWENTQPGTELLYSEEIHTNQSADWTAVDVSGAGLNFTGDFVVGFGWINNTTYLGYDSAYNNGRSWDFYHGASTWSTWNEAYLIRAVVLYASGVVDILEPVYAEPSPMRVHPGQRSTARRALRPPINQNQTDDFIEFIVYRDGLELGRTNDTTYVHYLPGYSLFHYYVKADYDEGESDPSNIANVRWSWWYIDVELTPYNPPIIIPEAGGTFDFNVALSNWDPMSHSTDFWSVIFLPGVGVFSSMNVADVIVAGEATVNCYRVQRVPEYAPAGTYIYYAYTGVYPSEVEHSDCFTFVKEGSEGGESFGDMSGWCCTGEDFEVITDIEPALPTEFAVSVHPNPFNPTTVIRYPLTENRFVNLSVYDVAGREVARLVDGWREAGRHEVTFDGAGLASGVYVYRLTAGDFMGQGKMVLLK